MNLTGQQINNTYGGLLKTEDNAALPGTGVISITDGLGNQSGIQLDLAPFFNTFNFSKANPAYGAKNLSFDRTAFPFSAFSGNSTALLFTDLNGLETASILQDRFGGLNYKTTLGSHVFMGQDAAGTTQPGVIRMDTFNSGNNSDNWLTGYNQSVSDLQIVGQDLTLSRQGATNLTVTLPGGGGAAGLVSGTGTDSMQSAASLTTNAAVASGVESIAIGNGARAMQGATNAGSVAIGSSTEVYNGTEGGVYIGTNGSIQNNNSIAVAQAVDITGEDSVYIGLNGQISGQQSFVVGKDMQQNGDFSTMIGNQQTNNGNNNIGIGVNINNSGSSSYALGGAITIGLGNSQNAIIGSNSSNIPAGTNSFIMLGRGNNPTGSCYNSIQMGLVSQLNNSNTAVAIGRGATLTNSSNSTAIGAFATVTNAQYAVALGDVQQTRQRTVGVEELEIHTVGGGVIMPSPDGTLYKVTVANGGTLTVSAV